jgi:hypothetical protein
MNQLLTLVLELKDSILLNRKPITETHAEVIKLNSHNQNPLH